MLNRPVWLVSGTASVSRVLRSTGRLPRTVWQSQSVWQRCIRPAAECCRLAACAPQHQGHVRYQLRIAILLIFAPIVFLAQEPTPTPPPIEAEAESVIVSATRFDIPLDQSPSSVSVITSQD